ncbi:unnamed protein product [Mycena citricolor]|uniref:Ima1 N-terminal domain-containing protein n=1 Tax=Mycena citricolor TaxID=2018698 RepID=A0AAD2HSG2_9AGAR|nr:unnamed protein product [Mycena citricolor]
MLRRRSNIISCFFCNNTVSPADPQSFRCPHCHCLNRFVNGNVEEPAMHDEALNGRAFSKRASPTKNQLPTMYGSGIFCHDCQTNQMLVVNLLANYLPPQDEAGEEGQPQTVDEYRESLYRRYPQVCESCRPAMEEEVNRKNNMARSKALGGLLKQTKGKTKQRQVSLTAQDNVTNELLFWRVRGGLWITTVLGSAFGQNQLLRLSFLAKGLPFLALLSILWVAWDPTYSTYRAARIQGRDVRILGKQKHIMVQMMAWSLRLVTSLCLALASLGHYDPLDLSHFPSHRSHVYFVIMSAVEFTALIVPFLVLEVQRPPAIRLIDTSSHKIFPSSRSQTPVEEPDLFAGLSLSAKPVSTPPVFGQTSMQSSIPARGQGPDTGDSMDVDWSASDSKPRGGDAVWLRPQRFFAPEAPTGLEAMFERTKILDDVTMTDVSREKPVPPRRMWAVWIWALVIPVVAIAYTLWITFWMTPPSGVSPTFEPDYWAVPEAM